MDMEVLYYIECRKKRRRRRRDTFDITNFCREEKNKQSEQKCKQCLSIQRIFWRIRTHVKFRHYIQIAEIFCT